LKSPRNKTIELDENDRAVLRGKVLTFDKLNEINLINSVICGDCLQIVDKIAKNTVDLLILDPPYNMNKKFGGFEFGKISIEEYSNYLSNLFTLFTPLLKNTATIYICGDWFSSTSIYLAASKYFKVRNRITWEREKGRGALSNWKNCSEDVWFCTLSNEYVFNVGAVKLRKKVLAPYKDDGIPKDWEETSDGNYRDTYPSNLWTDITVPFWSMAENTDHPTQKSEKFMAKLILASSNDNDLIFDPFCGVGSSLVAAHKLNRRYIGIDIEENYALLAQKRLDKALIDKRIQGYDNKVFWERNSKQC
jgi:site-specific DNA-methyltransferase (adenine-specific)